MRKRGERRGLDTPVVHAVNDDISLLEKKLAFQKKHKKQLAKDQNKTKTTKTTMRGAFCFFCYALKGHNVISLFDISFFEKALFFLVV